MSNLKRAAKTKGRGRRRVAAGAGPDVREVARVSSGSGEVVIVDAARYDALAAKAEDAEDARIAAATSQYDERDLIPSDVVKRKLAGEVPLRVWREQRGMKAKDLAAAAGISAAYLSDIERAKVDGSLLVMARLADALDVLVDDLVPTNRAARGSARQG